MIFYFSETLNIEKFEGIHLLQDHIGTNFKGPWDDFDYIITFQVFHVSNQSKKKLGNIKVLSKNSKNTSTLFKKESNLVSEKIYNISDILDPAEFISIGEKFDYYKIIKSIFSSPQNERYLESICDICFHRSNLEEYIQWEGYQSSFMRSNSSSAILNKGFQIALGQYIANKNFEITIDTLGDTFEPITFNFNKDRPIGESNICLLIGKNGVGKSHILKEISKLVTGLSPYTNTLPAFHKLIIIAYSPFENFYCHNQIFNMLDERYSSNSSKSKKSYKRKRMHINEYSYIGFKNEEGNFDLDYPAKRSIESLIKIIKYDQKNNWWKEEKTRFLILKETLKLCMDFDDIFIIDNNNNETLISNDLSLNKIKESSINYKTGLIFKKNNINLSLSSGQIIYSYILPSIMSEIEEESLLILDEPELYLHPELEVNLINMIKNILFETNSYSIIATHSSIIAREVERKSINILRKKDNITRVFKPSIETYGESIVRIIAEVFDDNYIEKPFQHEINKFINSNENFSLDNIKNLVGDDALIHLLSEINKEEEIIIIEDNK
ncbi:AAA family ATPase [Acinetobacter sp. YH12064]|uniref:AAA family ATPase n=2 Tax=unclassified Acinetobacter TaxID=196816 RepID=UPI0015D1AAD4|nr:AAA family ATPase [Acinetobacter sp. YH12064]